MQCPGGRARMAPLPGESAEAGRYRRRRHDPSMRDRRRRMVRLRIVRVERVRPYDGATGRWPQCWGFLRASASCSARAMPWSCWSARRALGAFSPCPQHLRHVDRYQPDVLLCAAVTCAPHRRAPCAAAKRSRGSSPVSTGRRLPARGPPRATIVAARRSTACSAQNPRSSTRAWAFAIAVAVSSVNPASRASVSGAAAPPACAQRP